MKLTFKFCFMFALMLNVVLDELLDVSLDVVLLVVFKPFLKVVINDISFSGEGKFICMSNQTQLRLGVVELGL